MAWVGHTGGTVGLAPRPNENRVLWLSLFQAARPPAAVTSLAMRRPNFQVEHLVAGPGIDVELKLTPRETDVAALMRQGLTNRDIAKRLRVSVNTVKKHLASAYEKRGLRSRRQARL